MKINWGNKGVIQKVLSIMTFLLLMVTFQNCSEFKSSSEFLNSPNQAENPVDSEPPVDPIDPTPPTDPAPVPELGQHIVQSRMVSDGQQSRNYIVYLPSDYATRTTEAQIIIGFHPASNSAAQFQNMTRLHEPLSSKNHIIVYPDGDEGPSGRQAWNAGFCCTGANDLGFFDAILTDLASLTRIKPKVAITGFSSGAMMVYRLLCSRSDKILAAVPFGAYLRMQDVTTAMACPWSNTIPVLHMHGASDSQMDINGQANGYYPNSGIQTPPLLTYLNVIVGRNGGLVNPVTEVYDADIGSPRVRLNQNTYYSIISGQGHTWPGEVGIGQYGPGRLDVNGSATVLKFLLEQR